MRHFDQRLSLDGNRLHGPAFQRQIVCDTSVLHARQSPHPAQHLVVKLHLLTFTGELVGGDTDAHREHMIGDEPGVNAA